MTEDRINNIVSPGFPGALISNPACGGCAEGSVGMRGRGEVAISMTNRNFRGKQGKGETYLVGLLTTAYSALAGRITVPA